jgi:hypothetical protein
VTAKTKLAAIKTRLKKHTPEIAAFATVAAVLTTAVIVSRQAINAVTEIDDDVLPEMTGNEREQLLGDPNFSLLKITDDEFMFVRNIQD